MIGQLVSALFVSKDKFIYVRVFISLYLQKTVTATITTSAIAKTVAINHQALITFATKSVSLSNSKIKSYYWLSARFDTKIAAGKDTVTKTNLEGQAIVGVECGQI